MTATVTTRPLLERLRALADPTRLRILELLRRPGCCSLDDQEHGMCVCDLQRALGLTQPTITHHLKVLRGAGLVDCAKVGPWLHCRRNEAALRAVATDLDEV